MSFRPKFDDFCAVMFPTASSVFGRWPFRAVVDHPEAWDRDPKTELISTGSGKGQLSPHEFETFPGNAVLIALPPLRNYEVELRRDGDNWEKEKDAMFVCAIYLGLHCKIR